MAETVLKTIIQVRRDTTANWELHKDFVPAAGEPCLDLDKGTIKYGDGTTTYENLKESGSSASHYEGVRNKNEDGDFTESDTEVIERVLAVEGVTPNKDDIFVVKAEIASEKYSYTAYVYNGSVWAAMDGNYSADNVYFSNDLTFTYQFGKYVPNNGKVSIPAEGKNLSGLFSDAYAEDQNPVITQPSVSLTSAQVKTYEVGTEVTPSYTANFNPGSYEYDETTGVSVQSWEVTDTNGGSKTTASDSFDSFTVGDDTDYSITAKATHSDGTIPKTALENDYPEGQIKAGTKTATKGKITGYRSFFYGVLDTDSSTELTSDMIRGLTNGGSYSSAKSFTINANATAKRIVVAYPSSSSRGGVSEVILTSAMNTPITDSYVKHPAAVQVEGLNGYTAVDYDVYVYEPASIDAGEVHAVKLA